MQSTLARAFAFAIGVFAVGAAIMANAQQNVPAEQNVDLGKWEYTAHCAACHGSTGKGDGYFSGYLRKPIANLTTLSKANRGVFPFARVYETIDGLAEIQAHGSRDMPIWGRDFRAMSSDLSPYYNEEVLVRAKILALTEYIYTLQAK